VTDAIEMEDRLRDFLVGIEPFASPATVGVRFGAGPELAEVIVVIKRHFAGIDEVRSTDHQLMVELLTGVPGDDPQGVLLEAMGIGGPDQPGGDLAGAALALIGQLREPDSLWGLWERQEDVALEIFAWHIVARQRLTSAGIMKPIGDD
jgi:hypothetical protein